MAHYFTKKRAEELAKQDRHWRVQKSKQYDHLYMVWSDQSAHYIEFDDEANVIEEMSKF
jgi:hypothetical protein